MEIKSTRGYLYQLILILLIIVYGCFADCSSSSDSLNREVTVDSWTENWTFEGVEVATSSNDYFYLLSSADDNQCGIIRENASGEVVWARTYTNGQCSGLTLNGDKTWLYFSSAYTDYYGIGKVHTADGNLSSYLAASELTLTGKVTRMDSMYDFGGEIIDVLGNITSSSCLVLRVWFIPAFNGLCYYGPCNCTSSTTANSNGISLALNSKIYSSRYEFDVLLTNETQIQLYMRDILQNDTSADWAKNIVCTSTCPAADYARTDFDGTNVHLAVNLPSEAKVLIMALAVSNGDLVGTIKTTQDSQQMALTSLSVDSNSITWISAYSSSSAYSELIRYDSANDNYTVYQQTGISYVFQHIDSSNNNWFGLGQTKFVSNSTQACLSDIDGLSVSISTSGLEEASAYSLASTDVYELDVDLYGLDINTSITSDASDMDYVLLVIGGQSNEDDLSTGQIVNIVLSSLFGLACILAISFALIFIVRKRRNRYDGRQEVSAEVQREDFPEEDNDSQHNQDDDSQHYGDENSQHFEIEDSKYDQDDDLDNQA